MPIDNRTGHKPLDTMVMRVSPGIVCSVARSQRCVVREIENRQT